MKIFRLFIISILIYPQIASAQFFEIGLGIGGSVYYGDLSPDEAADNFKLVRPALGVFASHHFNDRVACQLGIQNFTLAGDDKINSKENLKYRNLSFRSNVWEIALKGEFYILPFDPERMELPISIYVSSGIAGFFHNPKAFFAGTYHALQPLSTEGQGLSSFPERKPYKLAQIAIPAILGLKYNVSPTISLFIEFGPRFTFTDYLDDVSSTYAVGDELREERGDLAFNLSDRRILPDGEPKKYEDRAQRGNPKSNDMYFAGLLGVSVALDDILGNTFGHRVKCPKF